MADFREQPWARQQLRGNEVTQIVVHYDGLMFETKDTDEATPAQLCEALYENLESVDKLKLELKDGSILMMPKDAVRRAVILIVPSK